MSGSPEKVHSKRSNGTRLLSLSLGCGIRCAVLVLCTTQLNRALAVWVGGQHQPEADDIRVLFASGSSRGGGVRMLVMYLPKASVGTGATKQTRNGRKE